MDNKLECQVIMLPGDGPIFNCPDGMYIRHMKNKTLMHRHLYLVSEKEIKEDDWWWNRITGIHKAKKQDEEDYNLLSNEERKGLFKVIASTDKSLGLPLISQSFIEEYIQKQGKIDKVYVRLEWRYGEQNIETILFDDWTKGPPRTEVIILPVKDNWNREEVKTILNSRDRYLIEKSKQEQYYPANIWFDKNY